jgi:uncharacterized cysteine cluster protein YcgN (CxxCxxCC family)
MKKKQSKFWEIKSLQEMTPAEWESLCDGCARCCLHNFQDEKTGTIKHIAVACEFLDISACRCSFYGIRKQIAPNCIELSPGNVGDLKNLPHSCAYRAMSEGKPLKKWHPLVSGDTETVHIAGISVRDRVVSGIHVYPDDLKKLDMD